MGSPRASALTPQGIHLHAAGFHSLVVFVTRLAATDPVPVRLRLKKALPSAIGTFAVGTRHTRCKHLDGNQEMRH